MVTTGYLERDVAVGDLKFHYQEWGNPASPSILMLHGFGVSGHMFDEFAERMQDRFHLVAVDQRGHGDSDWSPEGDYSRDAFVADVEGLQQALGLERFILVGHSMGGLNAVAYTVRHPARVKALVLVDVGPEAAKDGVDNIVRFTRGPDELEFEEFVEMAHRFNQRRSIENIRDRMRHRLKPLDSGKWTWKFDKRFREQDNGLRIGSQLSNDEMWQQYRSVAVPTLLVRGAESDVLTQDVAERAAREMQQTRLVVVPGAGHSVPGDNPDDFTAAVREFLGDLEAGRFEPAAAAEPPPLDQLMDRDRPVRRGPSLLTLVLVGIGAAAGISGAAYMAKRRTDSKRQQSARARAARAARRVVPVETIRKVDLEHAQQRALDLSRDLAVAGRKGVAQARAAVQEVEVERAREAARDVLHVLGEATRTAPETAREIAGRVDRKKLKKRGRVAAKRSRRAGSASLNLALAALRLLARRSTKSRKKRRLLAWRG